jgi:hypothetical protein
MPVSDFSMSSSAWEQSSGRTHDAVQANSDSAVHAQCPYIVLQLIPTVDSNCDSPDSTEEGHSERSKHCDHWTDDKQLSSSVGPISPQD